MQVSKKHAMLISFFLAFLYVLPATNEWLKMGRPNELLFIYSAPIWLAFFYIGPFWLYYFLQKLPLVNQRHIAFRALLFCLLMWCGTNIVNELHLLSFAQFTFPFFERVYSALLWGIFLFTLWETYSLSLRYSHEKDLREQAQLQHLTNQLNPHFLFNSLNTISALMATDTQKADEILHSFSDILRASLDLKVPLIPLVQEVETCKKYLSLEQARFGDKIRIDWQISPSLSAMNIPPLLLQSILENAIKHNKGNILEISVKIIPRPSGCEITIKDNGKGFPQKVLDGKRSGHGLTLIEKRLALHQLGELTIKNQDGASYCIALEATC
ncbi:ATPase [Shewanella vesiculosa]|uniref:sensor histidine kinase n=1 Tax=Shewanella vesiculosa TaxID=518738 RepID=UPI000F4FB51A|nr:histidine kinase [Shewanella vesiculosa]RPA55003.1 ATPase [Shewanella vesiculosa]UJL44009.1 histidine kinase [Shewanella vesiculosa]|tara:strand:+ start:988 stop:1968 length:981 start_codon:yes stop_codon:yes gene_type:complete